MPVQAWPSQAKPSQNQMLLHCRQRPRMLNVGNWLLDQHWVHCNSCASAIGYRQRARESGSQGARAFVRDYPHIHLKWKSFSSLLVEFTRATENHPEWFRSSVACYKYAERTTNGWGMGMSNTTGWKHKQCNFYANIFIELKSFGMELYPLGAWSSALLIKNTWLPVVVVLFDKNTWVSILCAHPSAHTHTHTHYANR